MKLQDKLFLIGFALVTAGVMLCTKVKADDVVPLNCMEFGGDAVLVVTSLQAGVSVGEILSWIDPTLSESDQRKLGKIIVEAFNQREGDPADYGMEVKKACEAGTL